MAGNRKSGFLRGNAAGRNGSKTPGNWFCVGCAKDLGGRTERTGYLGNLYCSRTYIKAKEAQFEAEALTRRVIVQTVQSACPHAQK